MTPDLVLAATTTAHASSSGTLPTPQIRYLTILPELIVLGGAVLLLAVSSMVRRPMRITVATGGTVAISLAALGASLWQWADVSSSGAQTSVEHAVVMDGFSVLVNILVSCAIFLTALVADGYLRREEMVGPEVHTLALVSAAGAMIMGSANDLAVIFLGLEILSIALYVLAAMNHRRTASGEAALKYFILGGFSSAIFVYGIALVYGSTGSTNLTQIADFLSKNVVVSNGVLLAGMALLLVGFGFKIAAVPFHMWTPDVYQGAPSPVTGFMAAVAKAGAFAALLRVFVSTFGVLGIDWRPVVYVLALLSLVVGAVLAVVQRDVKRMLAYSSINHAGFILLGVQAATVAGVSSSLYYLFAYLFMVVGSFAVVTVLGGKGDRAHELSRYRGLSRRQPWLAFALVILLLAQAGIPFTTGFLAKFQVVDAAVGASSIPLAVVAMVTAAIAAFFYLRVSVLVYSPAQDTGLPPGVEPEFVDEYTAAPGAADGADADSAEVEGADAQGAGAGPPSGAGSEMPLGAPLWVGAESAASNRTALNAGLLLDEEPDTEPADGSRVAAVASGEEAAAAATEEAPEELDAGQRVDVPVLSTVAVGLCVAVTVVFGIIPAPLVDFAHQATLLFFPK